ncbi:MAG: acyl carrier protein [Gemmatimonadales bacterium]
MSLAEDLARFIKSTLVRDGGPAPMPDESLIDRGLIDSLGLIQLVSFLESTYGVRIPDHFMVPDRFESIRTIEAMVEELRRQR